MMITDWLYRHKTVLITTIILLFGGVSGVFVLAKETKEDTNLLSDVGFEEKEVIDEVPPEEDEEPVKIENTNRIKVDVKGAIKNPKVYEVVEGTRIFELIELAGGTTKNASTKNINLSKKVQDEMVIYIYTEEEYQKKTTCSIKNDYSGEITEEIANKESVITENAENTLITKINLNTATKEILMNIPNIGEKKAESIIEYRTEKGQFSKIEELKEISGIGESIYEKIKDYFTL
ncbi:MAG: hypothetical protein HFI09_04050 [Bacilli bacterium]|nr:hypothetical protein [Bacilli bacterium]